MKLLKILLIFSFFLFVFSITFTTSNDFNQDLGRHLKLGEIIVKTKTVPKTNLFSYTNPGFPFINHHWFSEVIFYEIKNVFGPYLLTFLKVVLIMLSVMIVVNLAIKKSSLIAAMGSALLFSPLLVERSDIRPEIFAYLLFSSLLFIVLSYSKNKRVIYFVPLIMLLWINLHISFIFGLLLLFVLLIRSRNLFVFFLSLAVLFLNPNGIGGVFYPLAIFKNYGYPIVENQNLFFLNKIIFDPLIKYFFILSPLVILSTVVLILFKRMSDGLLLIIFFILSVWQIRHFPFFVLVAIPTVAIAFHEIVRNGLKPFPTRSKSIISAIIITINLLLTLFFITNRYYQTFDFDKRFGSGFDENAKEAADFMSKNNLPKNIFNNFDIGGYLIYKSYPRYKLFVDNRPEAYPEEFLRNIQKLDLAFEKYNINTLFFAHTDQTSWGRTFLESILKQKQWKLVFTDSSVLIFSNKTALSDIRTDKKYFQTIINRETNYLALIRLWRVLILTGNSDLAKKALSKAIQINKSSCAIKRFNYQAIQNTINFYQADELKKQSWWCF